MTTRIALFAACIFVALAVVLGLVTGDFYFEPSAERELTGAVVGLQEGQNQGEIPGPSQYLVQLDDGLRVIVDGTGRLPYHDGQRVVVREGRTRFFGIRRYRFVRFANPLEEPNNDARGWLDESK